jgi:hypothetical protein
MATIRTIPKTISSSSVNTTDGTTWTTIASYIVSTNSVFVINDIWVIGKDGSGNVASASGKQSGKRVSGTVSMIGSLTSLLTMALGSDVVLNTSDYRINISGDIIELQVKGVAATTIEWIGGFTIILH